MDPSLTSTLTNRVKFRDCDPLQIVWHGNYIKYFEDAREDFCRRHGFSYLEVKEKGFSTPVVRSLCEHKLPLKFGDSFLINVIFVPTAAAKLIFKYEITSNEKLVCTGETVQVFLNERGELVLNNPPFFMEWKTKMGLE